MHSAYYIKIPNAPKARSVYNFKEVICVDCAQLLCWILGFCPTQLYVCYITTSHMYSSVLTDHQAVCEIKTRKYFCELHMCSLNLRSHKISYTLKIEAVCYSKISLSTQNTKDTLSESRRLISIFSVPQEGLFFIGLIFISLSIF